MKGRRQTKIDSRGSVVLRMHGGAASPLVIEAAARVVRTFHGELRGVFIENQELLAIAAMPFAREISLSGSSSRSLSLNIVQEEMIAAAEAMAREFRRLTQVASIPAQFEIFRDATRDAIRNAMRHQGILAIGEPLALATPSTVSEFLSQATDIKGLIVVGCEARRAQGAVLVLLDGTGDVAELVDTAEKLAAQDGEELILLVVTADIAEAKRVESEARAAIDSGTRYRLDRIGGPTPKLVAGLVERHEGGLVIARLGGSAAADESAAVSLACSIPCPLLLMR